MAERVGFESARNRQRKDLTEHSWQSKAFKYMVGKQLANWQRHCSESKASKSRKARILLDVPNIVGLLGSIIHHITVDVHGGSDVRMAHEFLLNRHWSTH
jgi:hypothetical protein